MRIETNSPIRGGDKSPPRIGHYVGHSFATHVNLKYFLLKILFPKYCIKVFFTGRFSVLCLAVRLSWLMLFVVLWAITGVLGCSVVLAYAVCVALGYNWGGWLFGCFGCCCL